MPPVIFAINASWCWYQLHLRYQGWWCGNTYENFIPAVKIHPVACCPLPDKLPSDWFDITEILPVSCDDWQPMQYSPSARKGGRVPGLKVQKRPWIRKKLSS